MDSRLMLGYNTVEIFKSLLCFYSGPGRIIFLKVSATAIHLFYFKPQLTYWDFAIIIYTPFEAD